MTKWFGRYIRRERLDADDLIDAVERASRGLIDADLGGGLIKQRVARKGQGRSGGYRVLIAIKFRHVAVFVYGFAKNEMDNVTAKELETLKEIATGWLQAGDDNIELAIVDGKLVEVT